MQYLIEQPDGTRVPITHEQYQQLVLTRSAYHVIRDERVEVIRPKRERVSQYAHVVEWHKSRRV